MSLSDVKNEDYFNQQEKEDFLQMRNDFYNRSVKRMLYILDKRLLDYKSSENVFNNVENNIKEITRRLNKIYLINNKISNIEFAINCDTKNKTKEDIDYEKQCLKEYFDEKNQYLYEIESIISEWVTEDFKRNKHLQSFIDDFYISFIHLFKESKILKSYKEIEEVFNLEIKKINDECFEIEYNKLLKNLKNKKCNEMFFLQLSNKLSEFLSKNSFSFFDDYKIYISFEQMYNFDNNRSDIRDFDHNEYGKIADTIINEMCRNDSNAHLNTFNLAYEGETSKTIIRVMSAKYAAENIKTIVENSINSSRQASNEQCIFG